MNVSDLQMVLGLSYSTNNSNLSENKEIDYNTHGTHTHHTCTHTYTHPTHTHTPHIHTHHIHTHHILTHSLSILSPDFSVSIS